MTKAAELAKMGEVLTNSQIGGRRNLIINGSQIIAQRSTSVSSVTSGGYKALDRYEVDYSGSHAWTISQDSNTPSGFGASMKFLCTTAQALTGGQRIAFRQKIEGYNLQGTKKGTSDAESVTASFYVKSNKTGTYILEYYDIDNQRHINKAYTVDAADTWEYKTITFEADTTGSFGNDANASAQLHFWLGAGSTYTSGTLQSSWGDAATANRAVGNVNLADTVNNYWQVTGIQLEVGEQATPFEHRSFGEELLLCQRYYHEQGNYPPSPNSGYEGFFVAAAWNVAAARGVYHLPTTMRTTPTLSTSGNFQMLGGSNGGASSFTLADSGGNPAVAINIVTSSATVGDAFEVRSDNDQDARIQFDAEL